MLFQDEKPRSIAKTTSNAAKSKVSAYSESSMEIEVSDSNASPKLSANLAAMQGISLNSTAGTYEIY